MKVKAVFREPDSVAFDRYFPTWIRDEPGMWLEDSAWKTLHRFLLWKPKLVDSEVGASQKKITNKNWITNLRMAPTKNGIKNQGCRFVPCTFFGKKATDGTYGSKYWFPGFGFDSGPNRQPWKWVCLKNCTPNKQVHKLMSFRPGDPIFFQFFGADFDRAWFWDVLKSVKCKSSVFFGKKNQDFRNSWDFVPE